MKVLSKKALFAMAASSVLVATLSVSNVYAAGFGLPSLGGGGASSTQKVNWGDLASTGSTAEKDIYSGVRLLALSASTMAEALADKETAAALRAQVEGISEDGTVSGKFDLDATAKAAASVMDKIASDEKQLANLDESRKAKISESMAQYAVGGFKYVKGMKAIMDVATKAKDAPMMQMAKFTGIIKLAPTAVTGAKHFFGKIPAVIKMMKAAKIERPDNMDDLTSSWG